MSLAVDIPIGQDSRLLAAQRILFQSVCGLGLLVTLYFSARRLGWEPAWIGARSGGGGWQTGPQGWWLGLIVIAGLALAIWLARIFRPVRAPEGRLRIDDEGQVSWQIDGATRPLPVNVTSWYAGAWLISIRCRPLLDPLSPVGGSGSAWGAPGGPGHANAPRRASSINLLLARDSVTVEQWRGLRAWLIWRQRGGQPGRSL